jgi:SPP1 family predicted phage head-tail adaptor
MRAGRLDTQIEIQRATVALDDAGTPIMSWATIASPRAQVIQASTEEFISGAGATDETAIIFRTRFLPDVTTADRVLHGGTIHNIKELKPIGRRRGLEIRIVSQGATA